MVPNDIDVVDAPASESQANIIENDDGSKTLTLQYPVQVKFRRNGKEVEESIEHLKFRRMNGGDMRAVAGIKDEGEMIAKLVCRLTNITGSVFDALDYADIMSAAEVVNGFFPDGLKTGVAR